MSFRAEDKDPTAVLDYYVDWSPWLNGRSVDSVAASAENCTIVEEALEGEMHRIRVSGGVEGDNAEISSTMNCADGTVDKRSIRLKIKDR